MYIDYLKKIFLKSYKVGITVNILYMSEQILLKIRFLPEGYLSYKGFESKCNFSSKAHDIICYNTYWFVLFVVNYVGSQRIYIKMHFSSAVLQPYSAVSVEIKHLRIFIIIYLYSCIFVYY